MDARKLQRRLAAITFADVAGYTRLIAQNDVETMIRWDRLRKDVLIKKLESHDGRLIEHAGDALLLEFGSVVRAVEWAIEVQRIAEKQADPEDPMALRLRIAINVDDIISDDGSIYGDGVNISARIHQAAEPGQIVVTSLARDLIGRRIQLPFADLGTPKLKNVDRIVHIYMVNYEQVETASQLYQPVMSWSSRPIIAVMPFRLATSSQVSDYFSEGITEDIITGLSRSRYFHVIAFATMSTYAGREKAIRDIAEELGVGYILDGSLRRQGNRLRISTELINVSSNRSIWADRFDGTGEDIFDFQDQIVSSIVGALQPRLRAAEIDRVRSRPTSSLDAYDCVLKALSQMFLFTDEGFRLSGIALDRAILLDPSYAQAYAHSAWRLNFVIGEQRSRNVAEDRRLAHELAQKAVELDPEDAFCLTIAAHLLSFVEGRPRDAIPIFEAALRIDENSALAWALSGVTLSYCGRSDEARQHFSNAFRLSPFDRLNFLWWGGAGIAEFVAGDLEAAVEWLRKSYHANGRFAATLRILAASLALTGELDEAKDVARQLLAVHPGFRVSRFLEWYPLARDEDRARLEKGLLEAGLPN